MSERLSRVERNTKETAITVSLNLDGDGSKYSIGTGIGFFDHMLSGFARHGFFDLDVKCKGDLEVDGHHTVEDVGIVIGQAIKKAVGDKKGIKRYGNFILPMDDALVLCALDLSGRPYLGFDYDFKVERCGDFETQLVHEFFYALSYAAEMNIHIQVLSGTNAHHIIEAMFKAFGKALDQAVSYDPRITGVLSTKGTI
jgi:imidazoleglycerol-phosphate dehydratase